MMVQAMADVQEHAQRMVAHSQAAQQTWHELQVRNNDLMLSLRHAQQQHVIALDLISQQRAENEHLRVMLRSMPNPHLQYVERHIKEELEAKLRGNMLLRAVFPAPEVQVPDLEGYMKSLQNPTFTWTAKERTENLNPKVDCLLLNTKNVLNASLRAHEKERTLLAGPNEDLPCIERVPIWLKTNV